MVPQRYVTPGGLRLGFWQSAQRQAYKKRTLSKKRVARLENLGFVWDVNVANWNEGYRRLLAIKRDKEGHRTVPQAYVAPDGYKLGWWLVSTRETSSALIAFSLI